MAYNGNQAFVNAAYDHATREPFTFLLMDTSQQTSDCKRYATQVFEVQNTVYYVRPTIKTCDIEEEHVTSREDLLKV